ncbi:hypothetical protein RF11_01533 [Thelohanellus kitauei]|uniref:Uncharacterized protein n=1 Tax=Thelohanellus kitauei TaxID=669202 RepID=A0A0C2JI22_THEKT|nr:hypothetical protein RF11_01533 [Thelohanellus kitauei]
MILQRNIPLMNIHDLNIEFISPINTPPVKANSLEISYNVKIFTGKTNYYSTNGVNQKLIWTSFNYLGNGQSSGSRLIGRTPRRDASVNSLLVNASEIKKIMSADLDGPLAFRVL